MGGRPFTNDTLQIKLIGLQKPSRQRIDSVIFYKKKAIDYYKLLVTRSPSYKTIVGNAVMKLFNEQMYAYTNLLMAGYDTEAKTFLSDIKPDDALFQMAYNYLSTCDSNSILFTYGDNDSFPLWYVQEVQNFRQDITVINTSWLALPSYVQLLQNQKKIRLSTSPQQYAQPNFTYSLYRDNKAWPSSKSMPLGTFLTTIQSRKFPETTSDLTSPTTYPNKRISLPIDLVKYKKFNTQAGLQPTLTFELKNYMVSSEFLIFDIIHSNLYTRPIYFTADEAIFKTYLQPEGLNFRLIPIDLTKSKSQFTSASLKKTENFLNKEHKPIISTNPSSINAGREGVAFGLYSKVAQYYIDRKNLPAAKGWLDKMLKKYNGHISYLYPKMEIARQLLVVGDKEKGLAFIEEAAEEIYQLHQFPSANDVYIGLNSAPMLIKELEFTLIEFDLSSEKLDSIKEKLIEKKEDREEDKEIEEEQ